MTFGISAIRTGDAVDDVLKRADDALYEGKNSGRNCSVVNWSFGFIHIANLRFSFMLFNTIPNFSIHLQFMFNSKSGSDYRSLP